MRSKAVILPVHSQFRFYSASILLLVTIVVHCNAQQGKTSRYNPIFIIVPVLPGACNEWRGPSPRISAWQHSADETSQRDIATDTGSLVFNSPVGKVRHHVTDGSPPLQCFFAAVLPRR